MSRERIGQRDTLRLRSEAALRGAESRGYCLRTAGPGASASPPNICELCPNYRSEPSILAVLSAQRVDAQALAGDAERRSCNDEPKRHAALVGRLDAIITNTNTPNLTPPHARHELTNQSPNPSADPAVRPA